MFKILKDSEFKASPLTWYHGFNLFLWNAYYSSTDSAYITLIRYNL